MSKNYKNDSKWVVHAIDFEVDAHAMPCQLSQQTILAAVTVGFESNGPAASSIAALLAPTAQISAGETACSCLQWPAVLPCRPHRPTVLPSLA